MEKHTRVSKFGKAIARLELALTIILIVLKILLLVLKLVAISRA